MGERNSEILLRALSVLGARGEFWTKLHYAINREGAIVPTHDSTAESFCVSGAICKATGTPIIGEEFHKAQASISYQLGGRSISGWGGGLTIKFSEVREVFNRAIAEAEFAERTDA